MFDTGSTLKMRSQKVFIFNVEPLSQSLTLFALMKAQVRIFIICNANCIFVICFVDFLSLVLKSFIIVSGSIFLKKS